MKYPGREIKKGETDKKIVTAIQKQLEALGIAKFEGVGVFGPKTEQAVKTFQARNTDSQGNSLIIDGKVASITWEILFGESTVPSLETTRTQGLASVLEIAAGEIGSMEVPPGSNWGPKVKEYLASAGVTFPAPWCAGFVYWCFDKAAMGLGKKNPLFRTGGVMMHWNKSEAKKILAKDATANPALVKPGHIFIMSFGGGLGHTGLVESLNGGFINVIEGNTNDNGSREGIGVFRRVRKINSINKGFLEYKL
ncbi:hypothetical protein BH10BAC3_BH10BAC3_10990 [soil metagenome]